MGIKVTPRLPRPPRRPLPSSMTTKKSLPPVPADNHQPRPPAELEASARDQERRRAEASRALLPIVEEYAAKFQELCAYAVRVKQEKVYVTVDARLPYQCVLRVPSREVMDALCLRYRGPDGTSTKHHGDYFEYNTGVFVSGLATHPAAMSRYARWGGHGY